VTFGAAGARASWCRVRCALLAGVLALWAGTVLAQQPEEPEGPSEFTPKRAAVATKYMAAAANPLAAEAGREVLRQGGSSIDAVIAMQLVLNLVEPQSSGIGGGAYLVQYDASRKAITTYDGRETAPAEATPDMFLDANGQPLPYSKAREGGRAVATPGLLRMLQMVHRDYGRLPWGRLFEPAMRLAEAGFVVSPRLNRLIADHPSLREFPGAAAYFFGPGGQPRAAGERLANPQFYETLRIIANGGADAFYRGQIARDVVAAVRDPQAQGPRAQPGTLSLADLTLYRAVKREPVCVVYRGLHVCGMGPSSSGGIAVAQILGILDHYTLRDLSPGSLEAVHLISEASSLAYADRARYVADSDFLQVPIKGLVGTAYLQRRAAVISLTRAMGHAEPGRLGTQTGRLPDLDTSREAPSTSHVTAVDAAGNATSMTTTIEGAFGSRLFVRGFLLNNEMTDFTPRPTVNGAPAINRIEPGKRPRSSMAPTIVTDREGRLVLTVGSPGGPRIIPYVVQTLIGVIDWRLNMQEAVSLPHFVDMNGPIELEQGTSITDLAPALKALGHEVAIEPQTSGLQGIMVERRGNKVRYIGGADPRREGEALGD
jgi:gamma-glutamyltranspeptidase/glutathione hydrolase